LFFGESKVVNNVCFTNALPIFTDIL
jgi:hypothetical protein